MGTWFNHTNEALRLGGQPEIRDINAFADNDTMRPEQKVCKYLTRLAHFHLNTRATGEYRKRRVKLTVPAGSNIISIGPDFAPGAIQPDSFYDMTTGGGGRLINWTWNEFRERVHDIANMPEGVPTHWVYARNAEDEIGSLAPNADPYGRYRLYLYPKPNSTRYYEFTAKYKAYELTSGNDHVMLPDEYQHVLWEWVWAMIERDLGEGKEGVIMALAQQAFKDVQMADWAPEEERLTLRTMRPFPPRGSGLRRSWFITD